MKFTEGEIIFATQTFGLRTPPLQLWETLGLTTSSDCTQPCAPPAESPALSDKNLKKHRSGPDKSKSRPHLKSRRSAFSEAGSTSSSQKGKSSQTGPRC